MIVRLNKLARTLLVGASLLCMPVASRGADELIKPADPNAKPAPVLAEIAKDQMKANGERATQAAAKLNWRLGSQAYTFRDRSFFAAVDAISGLGLHYVEAFPGQKLDADPQVKMGPALTTEQRAAVKAKLAAADVKLISFGVVGLSLDEKNPLYAKAIFDFAKDMGIETIVTEAHPDVLKAVAPLADQYGINIALHNHSKHVKSFYWDPQIVLDGIAGLGGRFGACADIGHWQRSGIVPAEGLKKLEGHIIELHFKDLNKFGVQEGTDLPWGYGTGNVKAALDELKRQNAKVAFMIEYEKWDVGQTQNLAHCVEWFANTVEQMAK